MSIRLTLAVETGGFVLPQADQATDSGRVVVFHPDGLQDLSALSKEGTLIVQPLRPEYDALEQQGWTVTDHLPKAERFAAAVVCVTRAKALTRQLVAQAKAVTDGQVLLDGVKTDGIDSVYKALKSEVTAASTLSAAISKAHGKAFWLSGDMDLSHWMPEPAQEVEGFHVRPGVFSMDGVDPASEMLAQALPEKLGKRVLDLGAGWGYLSAAILGRAGVEALDMIEANAIALDCARLNVTDTRAQFHWADARGWGKKASHDTVVMNPPFHSSRSAEPALGQAFIQTAARLLVGSGKLWMVANRHLPYEVTLEAHFAHIEEVTGTTKFKVLLAERPKRR